MNRKLFVLGLIFALAFLGSCTYEGDTTNVTVYKDAEEESSDFITEALPFYAEADEASDVFYVRFYNGNHNIPYVAVRYFLEECASFELQATSYADGKYKYQNKIHGKSFPLVVDMRADTMYCPEWIGYITKTSESAKMNDSFVKKFLNIIETFTGQSAQTFNLAKYGFKIYGGVDDAYVPLCVMNQLFSCTDYRRFVYNGEGIYFIDSGGSYLYANYAKSSWYVNEDGSVAERPADLITLSYNLLCFTHDYLYGQPGYYGFADDGNGYADPAIVKAADALSFDALLRQYSPSTRELLLSSSYVDYMKGMLSLVLDVYGDAHATLHTRNFTTFTQAQRDELNAYMTDELSNPKNRKYDFVLASLHEKRLAKGKAVMSGKTEIPTALELLPDGKTAVIRFDGFEFDAEGWQDYYFENQSLAPNPDPADVSIPDDTMGLFYTAFYTILHDASYANVKNVLVDVSCNGGGVIVTCQKALGYLLGNYTQQVCDVHTGTMYCQNIRCDLNLDGKIDGADTAYYKRLTSTAYADENGDEQTDGRALNFAVLTSFNSFSCGNAFPWTCYEGGIPIIGEKSGGGSCAVMMAATADGWPYQYSSSFRWSALDGMPIENGAPVTKALDYEQFYDDEALQDVMAELFE